MTDEIAHLQAQLEALSGELRSAQHTIRKLERRSFWRPNAPAFFTFFLIATLAVGFWTTHANSVRDSVSPPSSFAVPSKVTAPFEVVDAAGKTIFRVQERDAATTPTALPRGAFIYTDSGKPVVDLGVANVNGGGGRIRVTAAEEENTYASMAAITNTAVLGTYKSGKKTTYLGTDETNPAFFKVFRGDGEKTAAILEREGEVGGLKVFGSGDKPVASIQSDGGDGKLSINDKGGEQVAGVFANDNGGVVKVMKSGEANTYAAINAINAGLGLAIRKGGTRLVFAGASGDNGEKGSVYVYGGSEIPVAGISSYAGGKGLVAVFNQSASAIAMLAESDKHPGGGNITATDAAGNGIFSAGFTGEAGDACVTRKSGLWCMGTNLPLQMK